MKHEFEPKGRHTQKGLTDRSLELDASGVDEVIERTEVAQAGFRLNRDLARADFAFTESEIKKAREAIDEVLFPRHHRPTPLPIPKQ